MFTWPEFIDPVFAKTSPKRLFSVIINERFSLVFAKTGSINLGTGQRMVKAGFGYVAKIENVVEGMPMLVVSER
jgi:hypothetical protein